MAERPIIFSAPMVRAILDGRKTQTRRSVKPQPANADAVDNLGDGEALLVGGREVRCPYGYEGDRLWVRESFVADYFGAGTHRREGYRADWTAAAAEVLPEPKWTPSIHMPRKCSRITLQVIAVRVERVQEISEADVFAEGVQLPCARCDSYCTHEPDPKRVHALVNVLTPHKPALRPDCSDRDFAVAEFAVLWDQINGKRAPWASNPFVWVVEFRRVLVDG